MQSIVSDRILLSVGSQELTFELLLPFLSESSIVGDRAFPTTCSQKLTSSLVLRISYLEILFLFLSYTKALTFYDSLSNVNDVY